MTGPLSAFGLALDSRKPGWWQSYDGTQSPEAMDLTGLEADAASICFFELILNKERLRTQIHEDIRTAEVPAKTWRNPFLRRSVVLPAMALATATAAATGLVLTVMGGAAPVPRPSRAPH